MAKKQLTTLLFDLGNVLFDLDIPATERALAGVLGDRVNAFKKWSAQSRFFERYETGEISDSDFVDQIKQYCKTATVDHDIIKAWNAMLIGMPLERLMWLKELRKTYSVALLSNTNALHIKWVHHYLEQVHQITQFEEDYFDQVYYSHVIGKRKPNEAAFRFVLENLGVSPEEVLFMDDVEGNIQSAGKMGIQSVLHIPETEIVEKLPIYLEG